MHWNVAGFGRCLAVRGVSAQFGRSSAGGIENQGNSDPSIYGDHMKTNGTAFSDWADSKSTSSLQKGRRELAFAVGARDFRLCGFREVQLR